MGDYTSNDMIYGAYKRLSGDFGTRQGTAGRALLLKFTSAQTTNHYTTRFVNLSRSPGLAQAGRWACIWLAFGHVWGLCAMNRAMYGEVCTLDSAAKMG